MTDQEVNVSEKINPWGLFFGAFVPNWLLARPEISFGAKACYARLCQYAGRKGIAYPKMETLGEELGICARQVSTYVSELEQAKLIVIESRQKQGRSNRYSFLNHEWMRGFRVDESEDDDETPGRRLPTPPEEDCRPPGRLLPTPPEEDCRSEENQGKRITKRSTEEDCASPLAQRPTPPEVEKSDDSDVVLGRVVAQSIAQTNEATELADWKKAEKARKQEAYEKKSVKDSADLSGVKKVRRDEEGKILRVSKVEEWFRARLKELQPELPNPGWGPKERAQAKSLWERYDPDLIEDGIKYMLMNWDDVSQRLGINGVPTIGILASGFGGTIIAEAKTGRVFSSNPSARGPKRGEYNPEAAARSPMVGWSKKKA